MSKFSFIIIIFLTFSLHSLGQSQQISVDYAQTLIEENINNPLFTILDVRTPAEYEAGHLANAHLRNFYDDDFEQQIDSLDRNRTYLIYCAAGFRSGLAYPMMQEMGFVQVYDMLGGFGVWQATGYDVSFDAPPNVDIYANANNNDNNCGTNNTYAVQLKVFLEGFYVESGVQSTALYEQNLIPNIQPYGNDVANAEATLLENNAIVDWVNICLHTSTDTENIVCQSAFLLDNGNVLSTDGDECIEFSTESNNNYYVSIQHQGHLTALSNTAIESGGLYDFSSSLASAVGVEALKSVDDAWVLYGGDFDGNGNINNLDFNNWTNQGASVNTYTPADADGNGIVNNLDYNVWALNRSKVGIPFGF